MPWEATALLWIQTHLRSETLTRIFVPFTHLGDSGMLFIVFGVLLFCIPKTRKVGLGILTALLIGALITNVTLKPLVNRTRPWVVIEQLHVLVDSGAGDPSFPSGHTTAAFAFAGAVLFSGIKKGGKILALLLAVLMGFSRLYVGVHYPTDVLGGIAVGLFAGRLAQQIWKNKKMYKKSSS